MALSLSETLARAGEFFVAEPAAVSLVAELGDRFVAIARGDDGSALPVGKFSTELEALAALERRAAAAAAPAVAAGVADLLVAGREIRIETDRGPALVRVGTATVGWNRASYRCEVLEPRELRGHTYSVPAAVVYDACRAADRAGRP